MHHMQLLPSGRRAEGILQGSLFSMPDPFPAIEGNIGIRRGHVAMIPNTREFFIALRDHPEYGTAHTVWGEVTPESMSVADQIPRLQTREFLHPLYAVPMRILKLDETFSAKLHIPGEGITREIARNRNITLQELAKAEDIPSQLAGVDVAAIAWADLKELQEQQVAEAKLEAKLARKEERKQWRQQRTQATTLTPSSGSTLTASGGN
mmetsp:Transcript_5443/g.15141  ORF Transcript_5443/g.15141 Transcript_5443/m.15141 type:complete len:208 (-) Transcript_5443:162-785(-)